MAHLLVILALSALLQSLASAEESNGKPGGEPNASEKREESKDETNGGGNEVKPQARMGRVILSGPVVGCAA